MYEWMFLTNQIYSNKTVMRYPIKLINNLLITSSLVHHACFTLAHACYPATLTCFFQIGDRVMAFVNYNAWAEVVCTPVDFVYKMPDEMTFAEAAAFSLNFVAAYMMLFEVANLREGMSVLVHSAGGGVVSPFLVLLLHGRKTSSSISSDSHYN